jgi:hypothetical protein
MFSALPVLLPNRPLRNKACTLLYLLLTGPQNPSQWTTCQAFRPPSKEMTMFFWLLIAFPRWRLWSFARRVSQWRTLPRSSLNECGYTLGSQEPLSQINTVGSLTHSSQASGQCWTPSSPSPKNCYLKSRQSVPQHILVEPLVTPEHQAHQFHSFHPKMMCWKY